MAQIFPYNAPTLSLITDIVVSSSPYSSPSIQTSGANAGYLQVRWANYDGTTGAIEIQVANNDVDSQYENYGGMQGALINMNTETGLQGWEFGDIGYAYVRFKFYLGDGTTATLSADYTLKDK